MNRDEERAMDAAGLVRVDEPFNDPEGQDVLQAGVDRFRAWIAANREEWVAMCRAGEDDAERARIAQREAFLAKAGPWDGPSSPGSPLTRSR